MRSLLFVVVLAGLGCRSEQDQALSLHFEGMALVRAGEREAAIPKFEQALGLDPRLDAAHRELARIHLADRHWLRALGSADAAIEIREDVAGHHERRGDALVGLERWDDAHAAYDRALALGADGAVIHFKLGRVHERRDDRPAALAAYGRAASAEGSGAAPRVAIARILIARGGEADLVLAQTRLTEARPLLAEGEAGASLRTEIDELEGWRERRASARALAAAARVQADQEQARQAVMSSGILGALGRSRGSLWGGDRVGNVFGTGGLGLSGIGGSGGLGGLGLRGGAGGGGTGSIGLGNIGTIGHGAGGGMGSGYGRGSGGIGTVRARPPDPAPAAPPPAAP